MPQKGFPINNIVSQLIAELKYKRSFENKDLESNLNSIELLVKSLSFDIKNSDTIIKEHCNALRLRVTDETDEKIKRINENHRSFIEKINDYENECLFNYKKNKDLKSKIDELIIKIENFLSDNRKCLNKIELNQRDLELTNDLAKGFRLKLEEQKLNIESLMFNYKQLEFEPIKIDNSSIGVLKFIPLSVFFLFLFNF